MTNNNISSEDDLLPDYYGANFSYYYGDDGGGGTGGDGDFRAEHYIWIVGGAVLLLMGTCGNVLAMAVLSRPRMRRSNVSIYLMVVAVADLVALYTGLLRQVILTATGNDIRQHSEAMCKTHTTVVYFSLDLSAWLLAALSVERCVSVRWPHRVKRHCTRMTSFGVITGLGLLLFAVHVHFFFLVGDVTVTARNRSLLIRCVPLSEQGYRFVAIIWPWIDLSLFALLPLTVHIFCNTIIVRSVLRSIRKTGRTRGSSAGLTSAGRAAKKTSAREQTAPRSEIQTQDHPPAVSSNSEAINKVVVDVNPNETNDVENYAEINPEYVTGCGGLNGGDGVNDDFSSDLSHRRNNGENDDNSISMERTTTSSPKNQNPSSINNENLEVIFHGDTDSESDKCIVSHMLDSTTLDPSNSTRAHVENYQTNSVLVYTSHVQKGDQNDLCDITTSTASLSNNKTVDGTNSSTMAEDKKKALGSKQSTTMKKDSTISEGDTGNLPASEESSMSIKRLSKIDSNMEENQETIQASSARDDLRPSTRPECRSFLGSSYESDPCASQCISPSKSEKECNKAQTSGSECGKTQTSRGSDCNKTQTSPGSDCDKAQTSQCITPQTSEFSNAKKSRSQSSSTRTRKTPEPKPSSSLITTNGHRQSSTSRPRLQTTRNHQKSEPTLSLQSQNRQWGSSSAGHMHRPRASGQQSEEDRVSSMTWMLVTVSTVFCITTLPISLYTLINWIMVDGGYKHPHTQVTWAAVNILMYTNNAINFLLYSLSGTRFRSEMRAMWRGQCCRRRRSMSPRQHHHQHQHHRHQPWSTSSSSCYSMTSSATARSVQSVHGRRWSASTEMSSCS